MIVAILGFPDYPYASACVPAVGRLMHWAQRTGQRVVILTEPKADTGIVNISSVAAAEAKHVGLETLTCDAGEIIAQADHVVAFWELKPGPVAGLIREAIAAGKLRKVYGPSSGEVPRETIERAIAS
jgi:hypothetical protein